MTTTATKTHKYRLAVAIASFAGLLLTLFAWALASPVGASPDEDFHLISSWCAGDGVPGVCESAGTDSEREVSKALVLSACFAHESDQDATCQTEAHLFDDPELVESSRGNFSGTYPQMFYATMHLFASSDIQLSTVLMRFFNATLFVALIVVLWFTLPKHLRSSLYFTFALTAVPLSLFLIPSVNPSSWTITGTLVAFMAAAGALHAEGRNRLLLGGLSAFGLLLAAGSRYDGFVYALLAIIAAALISGKLRFNKKVAVVALIAIVGLGTFFILAGGIGLIAKMFALAGSTGAEHERSFFGVLAFNIASLTELWAGFSGAMGLGWLDTAVPKTAWMTAATLLWGTLFMRLSHLKSAQRWTGLGLLVLLAIVPLFTLQISRSIVGENVQSRYLFPLLLVLVATLLMQDRDSEPMFSKLQVIVVAIGLFGAQAFSIYTNMTRYISGLGDGFVLNLNAAAQSGWWWPTGPAPMTVLGMSLFGFALFLILAFTFVKHEEPRATLTQNVQEQR